MIRDWISECTSKHSKCCSSPSRFGSPPQTETQKPHLGGVPRRLIDVGKPDGSSTPRLVISNDLPTASICYATLSHCWGSTKMPLRTTKDNLETHLQGFDELLLPKTFRDAITISRKLGIQFLWIDSLCIIQDDPADWQQEAAQMASIYQNAHLTLAAASARNSHEGCRLEPLEPTFPVIFTSSPGTPKKAFIRYPYPRPSFATDRIEEFPLSGRGWILQEMILSRRIVYFAEDQMYWQCNTLCASEDGTLDFEVSDHQRSEEQPSEHGRSLGHLKVLGLATPQEQFDTWWRWVGEFSTRKLTCISDRLPALAGLIRFYQQNTGDEPIVGLWRTNIMGHLLWMLGDDGRSERRAISGLPSWSWMSIDAVPICRFIPHGDGMLGRELFSPTLVNSNITWSGEPLTSPLLCAELVIKGRVLPGAECLQDRALNEDSLGASHYFHVEYDRDDDIPVTGLVFLYMVTVEVVSFLLALVPVDETPGAHYRRVGMVTYYEGVELRIWKVEERTLTLV